MRRTRLRRKEHSRLVKINNQAYAFDSLLLVLKQKNQTRRPPVVTLPLASSLALSPLPCRKKTKLLASLKVKDGKVHNSNSLYVPDENKTTQETTRGPETKLDTSIAARGGGGSFKRLKLYNSEEHVPIDWFGTTLIH